jgi:hypothetical protein
VRATEFQASSSCCVVQLRPRVAGAPVCNAFSTCNYMYAPEDPSPECRRPCRAWAFAEKHFLVLPLSSRTDYKHLNPAEPSTHAQKSVTLYEGRRQFIT